MSAATRKSDTHEERYYHVPVPGHLKVKYATVFYRRELVLGTWLWFWTAAFCAHGDTFSRKAGRTHARRRNFMAQPPRHLCGVGLLSHETIQAHPKGHFSGEPSLQEDWKPSYAAAEQVALTAAKFVV